MDSSIEICEALVRYTEVSGSECFNKNHVDSKGRVDATVWCIVGKNAQRFNAMAEKWLEENGFSQDYVENS